MRTNRGLFFPVLCLILASALAWLAVDYSQARTRWEKQTDELLEALDTCNETLPAPPKKRRARNGETAIA
jgi:hypothetical protein